MHHPRCVFSALLLALALSPAVFAQGALTPPGAPAPTMKSLAQLDTSLTALGARAESRIAVQDLPGDFTAMHVITAPGSYYLRGNVAGVAGRSGIHIGASNVVLDLNGFAITGTAGALHGVVIGSGHNHAVVRNGTIKNWNNGIAGSAELLVHDLTVADIASAGVSLLGFGIARNVNVRDCGLSAIHVALAENCTVDNVDGTGPAYGIQATLVRGCRVINIHGGVQAYGIQACTVIDCVVDGVHGASSTFGVHGGTGIDSLCAQTRVENVDSTGGGATGIFAQNIADCVVRKVSGTSTAAGGNGRVAQNLSVFEVSNTGSSFAYGYVGVEAAHCSVRLINAAGNSAYGVSASLVNDCHVHEVSGTNAYGVACLAANHTNVQGVVGTTANASGITGDTVTSCRVISVSAQTAVFGIDATNVRSCVVGNLNGGIAVATVSAGIRAQNVDGCDVRNGDLGITTSPRGIQAMNVTNCTVVSIQNNANVTLFGILGGVVSKCTIDDIENMNAGASARGTGIGAISTSIGGQNANITDNLITGCSDYGIQLANTSRIVGNIVRSCDVAGISVTNGNVVTDNQTTGNPIGINVVGTNNFVVRNMSHSDTTAFSIIAGNRAGAIVVGAGVAVDPLANCDL